MYATIINEKTVVMKMMYRNCAYNFRKIIKKIVRLNISHICVIVTLFLYVVFVIHNPDAASISWNLHKLPALNKLELLHDGDILPTHPNDRSDRIIPRAMSPSLYSRYVSLLKLVIQAFEENQI